MKRKNHKKNNDGKKHQDQLKVLPVASEPVQPAPERVSAQRRTHALSVQIEASPVLRVPD